MIIITTIIIIINNDKIIWLDRRIKTQFLFSISNKLFKQAFGDHSPHYQVTFTSIIICNNDFIKMILSTQSN